MLIEEEIPLFYKNKIMKSKVSFKKPLSLENPYTDYQINLVKTEVKTKNFLFMLHFFSTALWLFVMVSNLFQGNLVTATINFICVFCCGIQAVINYKRFKEKRIELKSMLDVNGAVQEKIKQEKEDLESLDFFKQAAKD